MNSEKTRRDYSQDKHVANRLSTALFAIYLMALSWILLFKLGLRFSYMGKRSVNFIPFREPLIVHGQMNASEIILNVVVFVPLGIYAGILFGRWATVRKIFFFFLLSLVIEVLQFILAVGAFDITDIIANTFGGILGLVIFKAIEKAFNNGVKAQKFVNILAAIGTVSAIFFLALLKMNMLPIRYR